jgi:hypothetical protein
MIILGHDQIVISARERKPDMARGIMLEERPYRVHLEPDARLLLLSRCLFIISFPYGKPPDRIALDREGKPFENLFG